MPELSINNGNFLWITRGKSWDFRFLSKCSSLTPVVNVVYKTIFLRDESRFGYWKGFITVDGVKKPYVACRCYDRTIQRDEAGRRIPHDFLLLCSDDEYNLINSLAWESLILEQVRGLYSERYPICANEVTDCLIDFRVPLDSEIKPSDSCVTLDVSLASNIPQTNRETSSTARRFCRPYLFPILLICLAVGFITFTTLTRNPATFLPIAGSNVCVGVKPVTNAEYSEFVKATGHVAPRNWKDGKAPDGKGMKQPVLWVSYDDACAYCHWLGLNDAEHTYRLPTEAEWESVVGDTQKKSKWGGKKFWNTVLEWTSTTRGNGANTVKGGFRHSSNTYVRLTAEGYADVAFRIAREDANHDD